MLAVDPVHCVSRNRSRQIILKVRNSWNGTPAWFTGNTSFNFSVTIIGASTSCKKQPFPIFPLSSMTSFVLSAGNYDTVHSTAPPFLMFPSLPSSTLSFSWSFLAYANIYDWTPWRCGHPTKGCTERKCSGIIEIELYPISGSSLKKCGLP